jgi:polar amino acid transport system substrate-binding protein
MFTATLTSHLTARELSGLVRDAADLHHVRVGTVSNAVAVGYLDREGIRHQDFATIEDGLRALVARGSQKISRGRMRLSYRDWPDKLLSV